MSDLIRREDAIEAIANLTCFGIKEIKAQCDRCVADDEGWLGGLRDAVIELETLPSAEPEPEDFEWCHDCKEYDQEKHCCHRWTKVIRNTVEEIKTKYWKWIPVSEALPEDMDRLLVTIVRSDGEKRVRSGHYYKGYFMLDNGDTWNETDKEVLAWMPLPEPV